MCNCKKHKYNHTLSHPIIINQPTQIQPTYKWEPRNCCCENNHNNGGISNLLLGILLGERNNRFNNNITDIKINTYDDYDREYKNRHHKHHHHHHHKDDYYDDNYYNKYSKFNYNIVPYIFPYRIY